MQLEQPLVPTPTRHIEHQDSKGCIDAGWSVSRAQGDSAPDQPEPIA